MSELKKAWMIFIGVFVVVLILGSLVASHVTRLFASPEEVEFGVTFSHLYAESLGQDWEDTYDAILSDLNVDNLRIPLQWSEVEHERGTLDFSAFDTMMDAAVENDAEVTLVIGYKVPRWPECFLPDWAEYLSKEERSDASLIFFEEVVRRYRDHEALARWQIENEPFFFFGECPWPDPSRVKKTIALARELDPLHSIQQTTSGEQSLWLVPSLRADVIGVSLYRVAYNDLLGYVAFPFRPYVYGIQRIIASAVVDSVIISELQAEPWLSAPKSGYQAEDLYQHFTSEDFEEHIEFARRIGTGEIYLWGAEWWYYLKQEGEGQLWEFARTIFE